MTAAEIMEPAVVVKPQEVTKAPTPEVTTTTTVTASPTTTTTTTGHLHRRSSFQKIMHICNQGYSAFPHVFLRIQHVHTSVSVDVRRVLVAVRPFLLNAAVALAILTLLSQIVFCTAMALRIQSFLAVCVPFLGLIALRCFSVATTVVTRVHRSLSCRKKKD